MKKVHTEITCPHCRRLHNRILKMADDQMFVSFHCRCGYYLIPRITKIIEK